MTMTVTGYTSHDLGMRGHGITASGLMAFDGSCACGPGYPFFTGFYVKALNRVLVCIDRGSAIGDGNLDVWFRDRADALAWGVERLGVEVREWVTVGVGRGRRGRRLASGERMDWR